MKAVKYDVWGLDVWGNEEDGFDVNDRSCFQRNVEFPTTHMVYNIGTTREFCTDWPTNKQVVDTLIEIGFLKMGTTIDDVDIDGDPCYSLYIEESVNGYPICNLELVEN